MPDSMLRNLLEGHQNLTDELDYFLRRETGITPSTMEILEVSVEGLEEPERRKFFSSLGDNSDAQKICDKLYEVFVYFYIKKIGWSVEYEPDVGGKTPDLRFVVDGKKFVADVFVVNSPAKTVTTYEDNFLGRKVTLTESIDTDDPSCSRSEKIGRVISKKSRKYADTGIPLVLFSFIGDRYSFDLHTFEQAMYGVQIAEFEAEDSFPNGLVFDRRRGRALLSPENEPLHKNLSALVGVEIFDTLNKSDPGKRFQCRILHHFSPDVRFPLGALGSFSEVTWEIYGPAVQWRPIISGEGALVGRVNQDFGFDFGNYSVQEPF